MFRLTGTELIVWNSSKRARHFRQIQTKVHKLTKGGPSARGRVCYTLYVAMDFEGIVQFVTV